LTRIVLLLGVLLLGWFSSATAQLAPALAVEVKKPKQLENKKLGYEKSEEKKFKATRRAIQNTVTRFNWHFNANEKLKEIIARAKQAHKDDYTQLLSFYNFSLEQTQRDSLELDSVIYKANAAILIHDLRNDWIDNMYFLMGRAQFYKNQIDTASITFRYINYAFAPKEKDGYDKYIASNANEDDGPPSISTKEKKRYIKNIPPSRNDAILWLIKTYIYSEQYGEAAALLESLKNDRLFPERLKPELAEMQALWHYQQAQYGQAADELVKAIAATDSKEEQARREYLIGQLYERSNQSAKASEYFGLAVKHTLNPVLEVYARLNSIRSNKLDDAAIDKNIADLVSMARKDRNESYRDILYYSAAQMELEKGNDSMAIVYLNKSVNAAGELSVDPLQKSRSFYLYGKLAFNKGNYREAKRLYDSVQQTEVVPNLSQFEETKQVLALVAQESNVVDRQDSLQKIAALTVQEREQYVKKLLRKLRKAQGLQEEEPLTTGTNNPAAQNTAPVDLFDNSKGEWYFYNNNLKTRGYTDFRSKWGNRPNVDNWRRAEAVAQARAQQQADDANRNKGVAADDNGLSVLTFEGLMSNLPLTPEKLAISNDSIMNAQVNIGKTCLEQLNDADAAIRELETHLVRYPNSSRREEAIYYLYLAYRKAGKGDRAELIRKILETDYKDSFFGQKVIAMKKAPQPKTGDPAVTKKYEEIYNLFISGKFNEAVQEKKAADSKFANSYWTPQLLYIEALYYIRERKDDSAKQVLNNIANLFPGTVLAEKAANMIDVLGRRKEIEAYLTNLKIESPSDTVVTKVETTAPAASKEKPQKPSVQKNDSVTTSFTKPVIVKTNPPKKDTVTTVVKPSPSAPAAPPTPLYLADLTATHQAILIMNQVDISFINEAKNAYNRFNKQQFASKPLETTVVPITDDLKLVSISGFANSTEALDYIEQIKKLSSTQIIPWLAANKYQFGIINAAQQETLQKTKDLNPFLSFLKTTYPGKF